MKTKPRYKWGYPTDDFIAQKRLIFEPQSEVAMRMWCDPNCIYSPFHNFVGNENAIQRLKVTAYSALKNQFHECSKLAWALFGPSSTGKTTLAKLLAEVLGLPFVEISSPACPSLDFILEKINDTLIRNHGFPLVFMHEEGFFELPPMVIFLDEVHELPSSVEQGLLTATERKDARLTTPLGFTADTSKVTWVIATTDSGDLFDAFINRFTQINLNPYTYAEVAQIIKLNFPHWNNTLCELVAKYSDRVPREALAFAEELKQQKEYSPNKSWEELAFHVAKLKEVDEFGMSFRRVAVLKALFRYGSLSCRNLGFQEGVNCKERQLVKYVLPPLMSATEDQPRLVTMDSRGVTITKDGIKELEKRGIK